MGYKNDAMGTQLELFEYPKNLNQKEIDLLKGVDSYDLAFEIIKHKNVNIFDFLLNCCEAKVLSIDINQWYNNLGMEEMLSLIKFNFLNLYIDICEHQQCQFVLYVYVNKKKVFEGAFKEWEVDEKVDLNVIAKALRKMLINQSTIFLKLLKNEK